MRIGPYGWLIGVAGGALAASIAFVMVLPLIRTTTTLPINPSPSPAIHVDRFVNDRTFDEGTIVVGQNQPVRRLRRERIEHVRWKDPDSGAQVEMIVPQQDFEFVEMQSY